MSWGWGCKTWYHLQSAYCVQVIIQGAFLVAGTWDITVTILYIDTEDQRGSVL